MKKTLTVLMTLMFTGIFVQQVSAQPAPRPIFLQVEWAISEINATPGGSGYSAHFILPEGINSPIPWNDWCVQTLNELFIEVAEVDWIKAVGWGYSYFTYNGKTCYYIDLRIDKLPNFPSYSEGRSVVINGTNGTSLFIEQ